MVDLEKHPQKPLGPAEPAGIRASDADRDRIADILREAMAEGRLDAEEHSERIESVYRAKTMGELEPLVRDLPSPGPSGRPSGASPSPSQSYGYGGGQPEAQAETLVAVFSSSVRKGRWRIGARTNAFALFGNIEIKLTEALFEQQTTVINATSIFGNVEVLVPENITLRGNGAGVFGNFEVTTCHADDPDAPIVEVRGYSVFGNIEAKPKRGVRIANLYERNRRRNRDR